MGHSRVNPDWPKSNWPESSILHTSRQGKRKASLPLPTPLKLLSTLGAVQGRNGGASEDLLAPLPLLVGRCGPFPRRPPRILSAEREQEWNSDPRDTLGRIYVTKMEEARTSERCSERHHDTHWAKRWCPWSTRCWAWRVYARVGVRMTPRYLSPAPQATYGHPASHGKQGCSFRAPETITADLEDPTPNSNRNWWPQTATASRTVWKSSSHSAATTKSPAWSWPLDLESQSGDNLTPTADSWTAWANASTRRSTKEATTPCPEQCLCHPKAPTGMHPIAPGTACDIRNGQRKPNSFPVTPGGEPEWPPPKTCRTPFWCPRRRHGRGWKTASARHR